MSDLLWQKDGVAVDARIMRFLAGDDVVLDREFFEHDVAASKVHVEGLARIATFERREAVIEGLPFYEVISVTRIQGGVADNVVPDEVVATVNLRYPPDRTPEEAEELVGHQAVAGHGHAHLVVLVEHQPRHHARGAGDVRCDRGLDAHVVVVGQLGEQPAGAVGVLGGDPADVGVLPPGGGVLGLCADPVVVHGWGFLGGDG